MVFGCALLALPLSWLRNTRSYENVVVAVAAAVAVEVVAFASVVRGRLLLVWPDVALVALYPLPRNRPLPVRPVVGTFRLSFVFDATVESLVAQLAAVPVVVGPVFCCQPIRVLLPVVQFSPTHSRTHRRR